jgi:nitroreductase
MSLQETLEYRRSVRYFDEAKELDTDKVRRCIELATLAPNSSNMQLWEFYHITNPEMLKKISHACLDQKATKTAKQVVVFVTRRDLHRKRSKAILEI